MSKRVIWIACATVCVSIAPVAFGQFTDGAAGVDVQLESDVQITYPSSAGGHISASGTMTIQRSNAGADSVDLMITEMSLTGSLTTSLFPGPVPLTMEADLTDETRSNNAGRLTGNALPVSSAFDLYFAISVTTPLGSSTGFSSLNQDTGQRAEPARLTGDPDGLLCEGSYVLDQERPGFNDNPEGIGLLFLTQGANGTGITLLQFVGVQMTLSNASPIEDPPMLVSAVSRRLHGSSGTFDLDLPIDVAVATEPRMNGTQPQMIITFDRDVEAADGVPDCNDVTITNGTCHGVSIAGSELVINMTYDNNTCVEVAPSGIRTAGGGQSVPEWSAVFLYVWQGNVNAHDTVNVIDLQDVKNRVFQSVDETTFLYDVNADGQINVVDLQETKNNLFSELSCEQ